MDDIPYAKFWTNVKNNFEGIQYLIDNDDIYRVATVPLNSRLYPDNSGYIVMLIVNEADIMVYKEDAKQKIKAEGSVFITVTLACSLFTTVIILYLIHRQSKNITEPLQGIIDFTYKLNTAKKIDMDELMKLKEGEFQIERLVQAYKCLAGSLINKHDEYEVPAGNVQKAYPPNELHRPGRILWKDCFDKIPN